MAKLVLIEWAISSSSRASTSLPTVCRSQAYGETRRTMRLLRYITGCTGPPDARRPEFPALDVCRIRPRLRRGNLDPLVLQLADRMMPFDGSTRIVSLEVLHPLRRACWRNLYARPVTGFERMQDCTVGGMCLELMVGMPGVARIDDTHLIAVRINVVGQDQDFRMGIQCEFQIVVRQHYTEALGKFHHRAWIQFLVPDTQHLMFEIGVVDRVKRRIIQGIQVDADDFGPNNIG